MKRSLTEKIRLYKHRIAFLRKRRPLTIGKFILANYLVPATDNDGRVIKSDKTNRPVMRELDDVNDFRKHFVIKPRHPNQMPDSKTNSPANNDQNDSDKNSNMTFDLDKHN